MKLFDNTIYIRKSIKEVEHTILIAFLLVVLVIFLFLRNSRTTLIPVLAIPVALVGAFFVMYLFGFTINILTLFAVVLSIGLVVDDAIVVVENIYTKVEHGMSPMDAAYKGSNEIYFALLPLPPHGSPFSCRLSFCRVLPEGSSGSLVL
jgi:multidrug efflux pump